MPAPTIRTGKRILRTAADIANAFKVHERTVARWQTLDGWPQKTAKGWSASTIEEFLRCQNLGPFRESGSAANPLKEAIRRKTIQQAELARVRKERAMIEQAVAAGKLVPIESAISHYRQTAATIISTIEGFSSARDRELPETPPTREAWQSLRDRLRELDAKLVSDIAAALDDLSRAPTADAETDRD